MTLSRIDRVGRWVSMTCAFHCAVTPIFMATLPLWAKARKCNSAFEGVIILLSLLFASCSLWGGFQIHKNWRVPLIFVTSILLIFLAHLNGWDGKEQTLMIAGGLGIALGHWMNRHLCDHCVVCDRHA